MVDSPDHALVTLAPVKFQNIQERILWEVAFHHHRRERGHLQILWSLQVSVALFCTLKEKATKVTVSWQGLTTSCMWGGALMGFVVVFRWKKTLFSLLSCQYQFVLFAHTSYMSRFEIIHFLTCTGQCLKLTFKTSLQMKGSTPVLMCSVPGYDPSGRVDDLAAELGRQMTSIAIG